MLKKFIVGLVIESILFLKRFKMFQSINLMYGQIETEYYSAKTKETIKRKFPKHFVGKMIFVNTVANALKYYIAKVISTTGNTAWIGANSLMTQASYFGKDGIGLTESDTIYSTTTTKDDGGTGSEAYVKFKGVRTAAGSETIDGAELGLQLISSPDEFATVYCTQTLSQSLSVSDVYTVNWTITIS